MMCPKCLADYLDCTEHDLDNLIVEFKTQGCALFIVSTWQSSSSVEVHDSFGNGAAMEEMLWFQVSLVI